MKPIHNPYLNEFVVELRKKMHYEVLFTGLAYKAALKILRQKKIVAVVTDQDAGKHGIFVNFFNMPASTAKGTAILHLKTGIPIVAGILVRQSWGKFDLYFERISAQDDILSITQAHTKVLEKWIRKNPGQYLWTHKRWKTNHDKY
jgi:KDO2-lipid IV(A) lauroyltransferase